MRTTPSTPLPNTTTHNYHMSNKHTQPQPLPHTTTHYHTLPHTKQIMKISLPKDNRTFSRYITCSSNVCHRPTEKTLIDVGPSCTQQERNAAVWWGSCRPVRRVRTYSKHAVVDLHLYTADSQPNEFATRAEGYRNERRATASWMDASATSIFPEVERWSRSRWSHLQEGAVGG